MKPGFSLEGRKVKILSKAGQTRKFSHLGASTQRHFAMAKTRDCWERRQLERFDMSQMENVMYSI